MTLRRLISRAVVAALSITILISFLFPVFPWRSDLVLEGATDRRAQSTDDSVS